MIGAAAFLGRARRRRQPVNSRQRSQPASASGTAGTPGDSFSKASCGTNKRQTLDSSVRLGVDHLLPLGEASSSLSLLATLVFGVCVSVLLDASLEVDSERATDIAGIFCLSAATGCSCFTITLGFLEFYYLQQCKGVDTSIALAIRDEGEPGSGLAEESTARRGADAERLRQRRRTLLAAETDRLYENLTFGRKLSRNAMWASLLFLMAAVATRIVDLFANLSVGVRAAACVPLILSAMSVPLVVLFFRSKYLPLIRKHATLISSKTEACCEEVQAEGSVLNRFSSRYLADYLRA